MTDRLFRNLNRFWWRITGRQDIYAYRRALGYSTPDDALSLLRDGTRPVCGICESRRLYPHLHKEQGP